MESFAAWDGSSDTIFICGDPSDFVMDLQESVLLKTGGGGGGGGGFGGYGGSRGGGAEIVRQNRVLSLLFHCMSERTFVKVFLRSFPDDAQMLQVHGLNITAAAPGPVEKESHQERKRKNRPEEEDDDDNNGEGGGGGVNVKARLDKSGKTVTEVPPPDMKPPAGPPPSSIAPMLPPEGLHPTSAVAATSAAAYNGADNTKGRGSNEVTADGNTAAVPAMAPPAGPPPTDTRKDAVNEGDCIDNEERPNKMQRVIDDAQAGASLLGPPPASVPCMLGPPPLGPPPAGPPPTHVKKKPFRVPWAEGSAHGGSKMEAGSLESFLADAKRAAEEATVAHPPKMQSSAAATVAAAAEATRPFKAPLPSYMPPATVGACLSAAAAAVEDGSVAASSFWIAVANDKTAKWEKLGFKKAHVHPPPPPGPTVQLCLDADLPPC